MHFYQEIRLDFSEARRTLSFQLLEVLQLIAPWSCHTFYANDNMSLP